MPCISGSQHQGGTEVVFIPVYLHKDLLVGPNLPLPKPWGWFWRAGSIFQNQNQLVHLLCPCNPSGPCSSGARSVGEASLCCSKPGWGCCWSKGQDLLYNFGTGAPGRAGKAEELLDTVPLSRSNRARNAKLENVPRTCNTELRRKGVSAADPSTACGCGQLHPPGLLRNVLVVRAPRSRAQVQAFVKFPNFCYLRIMPIL